MPKILLRGVRQANEHPGSRTKRNRSAISTAAHDLLEKLAYEEEDLHAIFGRDKGGVPVMKSHVGGEHFVGDVPKDQEEYQVATGDVHGSVVDEDV